MATLQELETLSVPERVQLVEVLWDSIARSNRELPVPQWQKDELARRKRKLPSEPAVWPNVGASQTFDSTDQ
jgi:putative addiction module component (TIGR02574 family)